jgi:hypothetical protein
VTTNRNTKIPRPFQFKGIGKGDIIEEAAVEYETWAPAIQLLKFENGDEMVRLCYYTKSGKLAPRALSIDDDDAENLKKDIKKKPQIKRFLQRLLE